MANVQAPANQSLTWTIAAPAVLVFLWSTGFIAAKWGLPFAGPFTFIAIRFGVAAVVLIGISVAMGGVALVTWQRA